MCSTCSSLSHTNLSRQLEQLDAKACTALSRIRFFRNNSNPAHRLPPEILCLIFEYATTEGHDTNEDDETDHDEWPPEGHYSTLRIITHVCSYWRASGIGCASLWTTIDTRSIEASRVFVERSRAALLDVYIPADSPSLNQCDGFLEKLVLQINRFRRLSIQFSSIESFSKKVTFTPPASKLAYLQVACENWRPLPLPPIFSNETVSLDSIHFNGIYTWKPTCFIGLKHLSLEAFEDELLIEELLDLLEANPMLETLQLSEADLFFHSFQRRISLPHLRQLNLTDCVTRNILCHVSLSPRCNMTLKDVVLTDMVDSIFTSALPEDLIWLPNTHNALRLSITCGEDMVFIIATRSSIIEISSMESTNLVDSILPLQADTITELWIDDRQDFLACSSWEELFPSMAALEHLHLCAFTYDSILNTIADGTGLLPNLRTIHLFGDGEHDFECVRGLGEARRKMNCPINLEITDHREGFVPGSWSGLEGSYMTVQHRAVDIFPTMSTSF
jgi:hypothetical protein